MEIFLDRRGVRQIRSAARDAIAEDSIEALPEAIVDAFSDEDVRVIEKRLGGGDLFDFVSAMLEDWGRDDLDELFDLLESSLAEVGVDLSTDYSGDVDDTEVLEDEDEFPEAGEFTPEEDEDV